MLLLQITEMKNALFTNFTDQEFTGYWDGKGRKFSPGQSLHMPAYLAQHYAKHLVNRELLRADKDGTLLHKNGDKMTSPKFPEQVPLFMELFNKACQIEKDEVVGEKTDDADVLVEVANKNADEGNVQVVLPPDEEEEFEGKPVE